MLEKNITKLLPTITGLKLDNQMVVGQRGLESELGADLHILRAVPDGATEVLSHGDEHPSHPEVDDQLDTSHEGVLLGEEILGVLRVGRGIAFRGVQEMHRPINK